MGTQHLALLRELHASDIKALVKLIHQTIEVSYSSSYPANAIRFFKDFHSEKKVLERHRNGLVLVLEKEEGGLIGSGSLVGAEILGVFVHPRYQCRGLGKLIMGELEKMATINGLNKVVLNVSLPSKKFYENLGYAIIISTSIDVGEGQHLNYWEAEKKLPEERKPE